MHRNLIYAILFFGLMFSCKTVYDLPESPSPAQWDVKVVESYPQMSGGDPDSGFYYLTGGTYLGSGIPYEMLERRLSKDPQKFAERAKIPTKYGFAVFESQYGVKVVNGTCFSCHAGNINGETVLGLGNAFNTNQVGLKLGAKLINWRVRTKYKKDTATLASFDAFGKYFSAMAPYVSTNNPGVNTAARIAESCMRYRDPDDLTYTDTAQYEVREYNIGSDIPALWHMQKKNALYYTAVGRGDFTKLLFQASVLGIEDSTAAREAQEKFVHIAAWIRSLEPPEYPEEINTVRVERGKAIFRKNCKSCHGTYEEPETYPNKVVSLDVIGTDPLYASYAMESGIVDWYNESWFAQSPPQSWMEPLPGYIAPPLDGIWATAPYLHNGSVPTLYEVLHSPSRPDYWKRPKDSKAYDWTRVGWLYTEKTNGSGRRTYDTTLPGAGNGGHTFGDHLTHEERMNLIEYLKTI